MRADLTQRRRHQAGLTLVELLVTMLLLTIVLAICVQIFMAMNQSLGRTEGTTQNTDQARLAVQSIDRQIRSGNVFYDPADEVASASTLSNPAGLVLRVYTQANGDQKCVLWRIKDGELQTRGWEPSNLAGATPWRVVASNIVNTSATPAFVLDSASAYGGRLINLRLMVNQNPAKFTTVEFKTSIAGRNTEYGYSRTTCDGTPS